GLAARDPPPRDGRPLQRAHLRRARSPSGTDRLMTMTTTNGLMRLIALVGVIGIGATAAGCGGSGGHTARPISNVTATTVDPQAAQRAAALAAWRDYWAVYIDMGMKG